MSGEQTLVIISAETMGRGDDELGRKLLENHLHVLAEIEPRPSTLVLVNGAVRLATDESPALEHLQTLETRGTTILLCRTCLEHFGLGDSVAVGEVSNMLAISEAMLEADKVINL